MSLQQRAARSALIFSLTGYGQQALGFISTLVLARLLTPDDYGQYGLALAVVAFFSVARAWGFSNVYFSLPQTDDKDLATLLWLSCSAGIVFISLILAAWPLVSLLYGQDLTRLIVIIGLITLVETDAAGLVAETMLRKEHAFYRLGTLNLLATGVSILVTLVLAWFDRGTLALVGGHAARSLTYFVGTWLSVPRFKLLSFDRARARFFIRHGLNLWLSGLSGFLMFLYDDIAVGTFRNTSTLGNYRKAYDLSLLPLTFVNGIASIMEPTYAAARHDRQAVTQALAANLDFVAKLVFPIAALLAVTAPETIPLYLGPQWLAAIPMLQMLAIYAAMRPLNDTTGSLITTMGDSHIMRNAGLIVSIFMLVTCTGLTLWIGAIGAALSAGLAVILRMVILYWQGLRHYADVNYRQVFVPPLLAIGSAVGVVWLSQAMLSTKSLLVMLVIKTIIFGLIYLAVLMTLQGRYIIRKSQALWQALGLTLPPRLSGGKQ